MLEMHQDGLIPNYLPMSSRGQFGSIEISGMFTVVKIHEGIATYTDPGWYQNPAKTLAESVK